jgi:hypothetical protein
MVFPFATFGCFYFDPRKLSIDSIDNTEHESSEESQPDMAKYKRRSRAAPNKESCNRNLVRRDSRFAQERDYRRFDWCVDVSGKIECAFLRRIQNSAVTDSMCVFPRRRKTEWPHVPAHVDDVIVNVRRVDDIDFSAGDLPRKLFGKRRGVRARHKEVPRH